MVELGRVLSYPKISARISATDAEELIDLLHRHVLTLKDPQAAPSVSSRDPGDDYLLSLAAAASGVLVSGDSHLLDLAADVPVYSPRAFLDLIESLR